MPHERPADSERHSVPITLGPGAVVPILGLAGLFALIGIQVGIPLGTAAVLGGIGGTASLLVHEFGHVRVARQLGGIRSARVSLIWLGAATQLEGRYRSGREQVCVAIAGPRASFAFAGGLALMALLPLPAALQRALLLLAALNVAIGLLNLIPAAPMDGYKLALGLAWSATGSESRAQSMLAGAGRAAIATLVPATGVLVTVQPALAFAVGMMIVTLVAQKSLMPRPAR